MNIAIGSDHRGFKLKEKLISYLTAKGHQTIDCGTESDDSVDYPVYAQRVAVTLIEDKADKGILICGSGIGVCIAVNKFKGIRGATVREPVDAEMAVKHNDSNTVCIGADKTSFGKAKKIVDKYLGSEFEGGRHQRRVDLIADFEMKEEKEER